MPGIKIKAILLSSAVMLMAQGALARQDRLSVLDTHATSGAAPGYIADATCGRCHTDIYDSYQHVGMAKSFRRAGNAIDIEDFGEQSLGPLQAAALPQVMAQRMQRIDCLRVLPSERLGLQVHEAGEEHLLLVVLPEISEGIRQLDDGRLRHGMALAELSRDEDRAVLARLITRYVEDEDGRLARWLMSRKGDETAIRIAPVRMTSWDYSHRM